MAYAGTKKPEQRANLIAYLRTLDASPAPIPEAPVVVEEAIEDAVEDAGEAVDASEDAIEDAVDSATEAVVEETTDTPATPAEQ